MVAPVAVSNGLRAVNAIGRQMRSLEELAAGANWALAQAPGLTPAGAASFMATQAQESDYFRVTEEYAKNGRYAPYIGRTFEMVTWEENYDKFGAWCARKGLLQDPKQFVRDPRSLADYRWAWLGGVWFFEANGLWKFANAGLHLAVSQGVNGGMGKVGSSWKPNGWSARLAMYNAFLSQGNALLPSNVAPPPPSPAGGSDSLPDLEFGMRDNVHVASMQRFCNLFAWDPALPILPVSGNYLDQTVEVVRRTQLQMGIQGGDGRNVGRQTKAGYWQRGWRG